MVSSESISRFKEGQKLLYAQAKKMSKLSLRERELYWDGFDRAYDRLKKISESIPVGCPYINDVPENPCFICIEPDDTWTKERCKAWKYEW